MPPLRTLVRDSDPYVRKTAAISIAKLYDHDKILVESSDLIDKLNAMLRDENPTVVASSLAALMDIWERSESIKLTIDYTSASKLVQILPDCSEYDAQTAAALTIADGARRTYWKLSCHTCRRIPRKHSSSPSESRHAYPTRTLRLCSPAFESSCT